MLDDERPSRDTRSQEAYPTDTRSLADLLEEFHTVFAHPSDTPELTASARTVLHQEEHEELLEALAEHDRVGIARELADVVYVSFGTARRYGIDLDMAVRLVHASNMSKLDEDGRPIQREDGKILKGPGFTPPDMRRAFLPEHS